MGIAKKMGSVPALDVLYIAQQTMAIQTPGRISPLRAAWRYICQQTSTREWHRKMQLLKGK